LKLYLRLRAWLKDESGATAIEYGLIAGAMALMLIPALSQLTGDSGQMFQNVLDIFDHPMFEAGYF
jgi:Flp pilus assembly pilin Flp